MDLTHFSLFTGIGGIDLAAEWAGFETVGQCEWADYPTKVLEKHWPDVPKWRDIRSVTAESFYERTGLRTVDLVSGGFPCQPFSVAGKQKGEDDDRYLWPEMLRVIQELQPTWVIAENVPGLLNMGIEKVLCELESIGYPGGVLQIPACAVGAWHIRSRIFILAYSNGKRWDKLDEAFQSGRTIQHLQGIPKGWNTKDNVLFNIQRIFSKPMRGVQRNDDGIPTALDRLKCLGNAVVPQQIYPILQAIADIERDSRARV